MLKYVIKCAFCEIWFNILILYQWCVQSHTSDLEVIITFLYRDVRHWGENFVFVQYKCVNRQMCKFWAIKFTVSGPLVPPPLSAPLAFAPAPPTIAMAPATKSRPPVDPRQPQPASPHITPYIPRLIHTHLGKDELQSHTGYTEGHAEDDEAGSRDTTLRL